jgi:hypothetical protein
MYLKWYFEKVAAKVAAFFVVFSQKKNQRNMGADGLNGPVKTKK